MAVFWDRDWSASEISFRRALELSPASARVHELYGLCCLLGQGRFAEALAELDRAIELDPLSALYAGNRGRVLTCSRRFAEAEESCRRGLALDPGQLLAQVELIYALTFQRRYDEAIAIGRKAIEIHGPVKGAPRRAGPVPRAGRRARRGVAARDERAEPGGGAYQEPARARPGARSCSEMDAAIDYVERAIEERESLLCTSRFTRCSTPSATIRAIRSCSTDEPDPKETNVIGTTLAHYRITAALGAGGMGEVWRADGHEARARGGAQGAAGGVRQGSRSDDAVRARGEGAGELESSEHRAPVRAWRTLSSRARPRAESRIPRSEIEKPNSALSGEVGGSFDSRRRTPLAQDDRSAVTFLAMELVEGEDLSERISAVRSRSTRRSRSRCRSPRHSRRRTSRASSTAISSRPTSSSPTTARSRCSTSGSPRRGKPRAAISARRSRRRSPSTRPSRA